MAKCIGDAWIFNVSLIKLHAFSNFQRAEEIFDEYLAKSAEGSIQFPDSLTEGDVTLGGLRLVLSDRDLQKVILTSFCDSDKSVEDVAKYFYNKYGQAGGLKTVEQFTSTIHKILAEILEQWEDRKVIFSHMKTLFNKMTGKSMPLDFVSVFIDMSQSRC
jgi:hypothetical protein